MLRLIILPALMLGSLVLGGCAELARMPGFQDASADRETRWIQIPARSLLVDLGPALGAQVIEASERRGATSIEQRAVFSNDTFAAGENRMDIRIFATAEPMSARFTDQTLPDRLREAFPDLTPAAVPQEATNAYGLYTYVTATGVGGPTCILAWQRLADDGLPRAYRSATAALRLCRQQASVDDLLRMMDGWRWSFGTGIIGTGTGRGGLESILDTL